jgi:hypothetical protein
MCVAMIFFLGIFLHFGDKCFLEKDGFFQSVNLKIHTFFWRKLPNFQNHKTEGKKEILVASHVN